MITGIEDRLRLGGGEHARELALRAQHDGPPGLRFALADVVQERFPSRAAATGRLPRPQQLSEVDAVARGVLVERAERGELPIDRRLAAVVLHRRQHRYRPVAQPGRAAQPGDELGNVLQSHLTPVQVLDAEEHEPVLQVVGVGLDRVGRPLDLGQVRQIPLDRSHRSAVLAQHRPRFHGTDRREHTLDEHQLSVRSTARLHSLAGVVREACRGTRCTGKPSAWSALLLGHGRPDPWLARVVWLSVSIGKLGRRR